MYNKTYNNGCTEYLVLRMIRDIGLGESKEDIPSSEELLEKLYKIKKLIDLYESRIDNHQYDEFLEKSADKIKSLLSR